MVGSHDCVYSSRLPREPCRRGRGCQRRASAGRCGSIARRPGGGQRAGRGWGVFGGGGSARTMGSEVMVWPSGMSCPWSPCACATDKADAASKTRRPGAARCCRAMAAASSVARCQRRRMRPWSRVSRCRQWCCAVRAAIPGIARKRAVQGPPGRRAPGPSDARWGQPRQRKQVCAEWEGVGCRGSDAWSVEGKELSGCWSRVLFAEHAGSRRCSESAAS